MDSYHGKENHSITSFINILCCVAHSNLSILKTQPKAENSSPAWRNFSFWVNGLNKTMMAMLSLIVAVADIEVMRGRVYE